MTMLLLSSDWHIGKWRIPLRDWQLRALDQIVGLVHRHKPDAFIFAGDAFRNPTPTADDLMVFGATIAEIGARCPVFAITGNHDLATDLSVLEIYKHYPNVTIISEPALIDIGMPAAILPWLPRANEEQLQSIISLMQRPDAIFLGHCTVFGAKFAPIYVPTVNVFPSNLAGFKHAFLGHIHNPQNIEPNITYIGSPIPLGWSYVGMEGSVILYDGDAIHRLPIDGPRFYSQPVDDPSGFVRIRYTDERPEPPQCFYYEYEWVSNESRPRIEIEKLDAISAITSYCKIHGIDIETMLAMLAEIIGGDHVGGIQL